MQEINLDSNLKSNFVPCNIFKDSAWLFNPTVCKIGLLYTSVIAPLEALIHVVASTL
jgi:hypothetical protein